MGSDKGPSVKLVRVVVGGRWEEAACALASLGNAAKTVNNARRCGGRIDAVTRFGRVVWMGEAGGGRILSLVGGA